MTATDVARPRALADESLHSSGTRVVDEFCCSECRDGIVSRRVLPICPMCRGAGWAGARWRPFTRRAR